MTPFQIDLAGWLHANRCSDRRIRFFFFSNEGAEPPHIHVERGDCAAKFWIDPIALAANSGFRSGELAELHRLVREQQTHFQERWDEFFGD